MWHIDEKGTIKVEEQSFVLVNKTEGPQEWNVRMIIQYMT